MRKYIPKRLDGGPGKRIQPERWPTFVRNHLAACYTSMWRRILWRLSKDCAALPATAEPWLSTALDHPWVKAHPESYLPGTDQDLARAPQHYTWVQRQGSDLLLAHGRGPYFPGWLDTLQLNYSNPALQEAMLRELRKIAGHYDGVRCDMAMLVLPEAMGC